MKVFNDVKEMGFHWELYDPFLFCAHHKDMYPEGNNKQGIDPYYLDGRNVGNDFVVKDGFRMYHGEGVPGFPVHPHRGFETVTITLEGFIDHSDSLGASGRYGKGDVQWMTAGKGIQHAEIFPLVYPDKKNPLELFQVWINLPRASKFVDPYYKMLWAEEIPIHKTETKGKLSTVRVIAGDFKDTVALSPTPDSWAARAENEVAIWLIKLEKGAHIQLPKASEDITRAVYFYKGGKLEGNNEILVAGNQAIIPADQDISYTALDDDARFLVLQGRAINEPVAQYGPFVMNTKSEIQETYQEYTQTRFGGWPWDRPDPVHGKEAKRFSSFKDEYVEKP